MGAFEYTALDPKGKERKGVLEGDTPRQIRQRLRDQGFSPLSVVEVKQREARRGRRRMFQRGISSTDLAVLTRQFATLVRSGLPVEEALRAVSQQSEKARIRSMLMGVRSKVLEGHTLANALADFPHVFSDLFRSTVAAGEQSGHLDVVLERLADYTEGRQALVQKISVALIYPSFMVVVAIGIVTALLVYVVPKVVGVFADVGQELPGLTLGMIALSDFLIAHGVATLAGVVAVMAILYAVVQRPGPRKRFHALLLRLPLLGRLSRGLNAARFARTLSILTASGVPVLDALRISSQVLTNLVMREGVRNATTMIREGASIHVALDKAGYFPPMTIHLIASGESSGRLEEMLERAAAAQEREMETLIAAIMGLFEPVMIVVMGGIVLLIVLAILLPIFDMNTLVQ